MGGAREPLVPKLDLGNQRLSLRLRDCFFKKNYLIILNYFNRLSTEEWNDNIKFIECLNENEFFVQSLFNITYCTIYHPVNTLILFICNRTSLDRS